MTNTTSALFTFEGVLAIDVEFEEGLIFYVNSETGNPCICEEDELCKWDLLDLRARLRSLGKVSRRAVRIGGQVFVAERGALFVLVGRKVLSVSLDEAFALANLDLIITSRGRGRATSYKFIPWQEAHARKRAGTLA